MEKDPFLKHWASLRKNQKVQPRPVPYRHAGSTYAEDGIRLTGSRTFVDSVLSRLKDLLLFENDETWLRVVYKRSADRESGKQLSAWNCYVQVHKRAAGRSNDEKKKERKRK